MSCNTEKLFKVYEETKDIGLMHDVMSRVTEIQHDKHLETMGKRFGYYLAPSEKLGQFAGNVEAMIGKTVQVTDVVTDSKQSVVVKTAEYVDAGIVAINGKELIVDMNDPTITVGGANYVQMGSSDGTIKGATINQVNGSVLQNLDKLIATTQAKDGDTLKGDFKEYLGNIFNKYKDILMEAGKDVVINVEFIKALDGHTEKQGRAQGQAAFGAGQDNKIKLLLGNTNYRTNTEVMAEELQHILISQALQNNDEIRASVEELRSAMRNEFNEQYKGEGWRLFLAGNPNYSSTDELVAQEMFEYAFNNKTNPAEEFLAHATTNQAIVRAMVGITETSKLEWLSQVEEKGRTWAKIWNQIVSMINSIYASKKFKGNTAHEYAVGMLHKLLEFEHVAKQEAEKSMYQKALDLIGKGDRKIAEVTEQINGEYRDMQEKLEKSKKAKVDRVIRKIWNIRGLSKVRSALLQNNIFNSISRNMKNKDVAKFYEMFRHSKEFVEKEVVAVRHRLAKMLDEEFGLGKVEKGLRKAAKRVLIDIDGQVLGDSAEIMKYLSDEALVKEKLDEYTKGLSAEVVQAIDDLADLLVHNKTNNLNVYTNAAQIAWKYMSTTDKKVTDPIDKAITLRAMQKLDSGDKALALKALKQEPVGMDKAMELIRAERAEILKQAYKGNRLQEVKGAKQEQFTKDQKRYLVDEEEMKELVKAKLVNLGKHEELSELLGKPIYTVVGDSLDIRYTEGLLKIVQLSNEGESLKHILMKLGDLDEEQVDGRIEYLRQRKRGQETTLVPERNAQSGHTYDYRIRVPYTDKVKYLSMDDDLITTVASTVANLTHKQRAMLDNYATLQFLQGYYADYKNTDDNKFIEIGPKSEGKYKDYWQTIPYYIRNKIEADGKPLMVTEAMLVDLFGYHDASIINMPWIKDKKKRQLIAKKFESVVMELIGYFKMQLVALTPDTIMGNNISNMIMTMVQTGEHNPLTYLSKYKKIWGLMNDYQKVRKEVIDLQLKKKAGETGLDPKIKSLEATLKNNPIHVIMEDGQYNVIFEDLNTAYFDNEGIIEGKINEVIGKIDGDGRKSRKMLKKLIDTVYLRKESAMHDTVMKATTYSDAVSKMIILMDAKEKVQELKKKGVSSKEIGNQFMGATAEEVDALLKRGVMPKTWLNHVDMMFVNYSYLDNKYIKYANDMGGLLFTKYFFRVIPAMAKLMATKGVSIFVTEGLQKVTGIDIDTPFDPWANPLDSLMRRVSLWLRPEDVFETNALGPVGRMFVD